MKEIQKIKNIKRWAQSQKGDARRVSELKNRAIEIINMNKKKRDFKKINGSPGMCEIVAEDLTFMLSKFQKNKKNTELKTI